MNLTVKVSLVALQVAVTGALFLSGKAFGYATIAFAGLLPHRSYRGFCNFNCR